MLFYMPAEVAKTRHPKFAQKFVGPYRILEVTMNTAVVSLIGKK